MKTAALTIGAMIAAAATFSAIGYQFPQAQAAGKAEAATELKELPNQQTASLRDLVGVVMAYTGERVPAEAPYHYVDGDTFDLQVKPFKNWSVPLRIRLMNVNTPETRSPKCAREKELAKEATAFVKATMSKPGAVIELSTLGGYDEFNRYLATVTVDGEDLGEMLIDAGLARVWTEKHEGQSKMYWCNQQSGS
jgi:endonuclease YncB( thermonuclease family)